MREASKGPESFSNEVKRVSMVMDFEQLWFCFPRQENVTVVTQKMQHSCFTVRPRPAPLSGLFNLWVRSVVKFMISLRGGTG